MKTFIAALIALSTVAAIAPANASFGPNSLMTFEGPGFGPADIRTAEGPGFGPSDLRSFEGPAHSIIAETLSDRK